MKIKDFDIRVFDEGKFHYMKEFYTHRGENIEAFKFSMGENDEIELYTGLKDYEGKRIFENDIVKMNIKNKELYFQVILTEDREWVLMNKEGNRSKLRFLEALNVNVVGNTHEDRNLIQ